MGKGRENGIRARAPVLGRMIRWGGIPRSPSLNHNVKQRRPDDFHVDISNGSTTSQPVPRSSVGAGYRCGGPPKSNAKNGNFSVFFQCLWKAVEPSKIRLFQPHMLGARVRKALKSLKSRAEPGQQEPRGRRGFRALWPKSHWPQPAPGGFGGQKAA